MTKDQYLNLPNEDKVEFLNKYQGKAKECQEDNDFSWSFATSHCAFVKRGNVFYSDEETEIKEINYDDKDLLMIMKMRKEKKVPKTYRISESILSELKEFAKGNLLKENEIVMCALKEYMEKRK